MPTLRSLLWLSIAPLFTRLSQPPRGRHFLVLRLTLLVFTLSASVAWSASVAGLVGFWNFDEGAGLIANDFSGNNNTAVLVNERQWTTGRSGLSFDGIDDIVEIEHSASLNITRELTVSAWIYNQAQHEPLLTESESEYHIIAAKGWAADVDGSWTLGWNRKTNELFFCIRRRNNNDFKCASVDFGNLTTNWHLVTGVFNNNGRIRLYVDGALAAGPVNLGTERMHTNTEPVYLGSNWHGYLHDVRIYNAALNEVAVAKLNQSATALGSSYQSSNAAGGSPKNFDFSIKNSGNLSTIQGSAVSTDINLVLDSDFSRSVSFEVSGLPGNVTSSFSPSSCRSSCSTVLTLQTNSSTPIGDYTINVGGQAGWFRYSTSFNLSISQATIATVATPTITPDSGSFNGSVSVSIQNATSGSSIYYTTDGSSPTQSSTPYTEALKLIKSAVVKAKAFKSGYAPSSEARASLTVTQPFDFSLANSGDVSVAAGSSASNNVTASLSSGSDQAVSFSVSGLPSGATGSFSSASCNPSCTSTLTISTSGSTSAGNFPITITSSGGGVTRTTAFTLSVTPSVSLVVATPTITPDRGTFSGSVSVTMATATSGASIYYTTDGSTPTQLSSPYDGAITVTSSGVVRAKAFKSGYNASTEASATFTVVPAPAPKLTVTWQDNSTNEDNFDVERKIGTNGLYVQIVSLPANNNSYLDTSVLSGTTYCYRVRAANSSEVSGYSNEACATVP